MVYNTGRDPIIMYVVQFDREFQPTLDQIGRLAQAELLMLMIKQQKKNLHVHVTTNNEAIQAQQQLLQDLYPDQQSSQETLLPTEPDPGPGHRKLHLHIRKFSKLVISNPCKPNYLSYSKIMFCKIGEAVNVNKQVQRYTGVSFLDSKGLIKSR